MKSTTRCRVYLWEATIVLIAARLAVRLVPPAHLFAWAERRPRHVNRFNGEAVSWVSWAVNTIGERRWMKAHALPKALATVAMLRRRSIASKLCLGVTEGDEGFSAYAWVERGQEIVMGGALATQCSRLAEFGGGSD